MVSPPQYDSKGQPRVASAHPQLMPGDIAALPEVEEKASKRKSKTPERGRSAADEDEDALQSAKCFFELKVE